MNTRMLTNFDKRVLIMNRVLLFLLVLMTVVPMGYILIASFMDPQVLASRGISFNPQDWTIEGYQRVFSDNSILRGFINSLLYSTVFAALTVIVSVMTAYPLSKKDLIGRQYINYFLIFTMFFGGGLIPTYLLVKNLGMLNSMWAIVLPGAVNVWNIILAKTYFQSLPDELIEAAVLDGANEFQIFLKIILPLAKPIMFVLFLYAFVGQWNSYVPYMKNDEIYPRVFMKEKDLDKIAQIEADMMDYVTRKRSEWITNGGIDDEWDNYLKDLKKYGLEDYMTLKQKYYDDFKKNQK